MCDEDVHNSNSNNNCVENNVDTDDDSYDAAGFMLQRGELLRRLRQMEIEDESQRSKGEKMVDGEDQHGGDISSSSSSSSLSTTTTLSYNSYLKNQRGVYDDYKHVNYKYIDFGVIRPAVRSDDNNIINSESLSSSSSSSLIIEQDRNVGKGGIVWDAAYILADSLIRYVQQEEGWPLRQQEHQHQLASSVSSSPSVVDLGSGTGVCGLMVARAFPNAKVHLTDLPALQELLQRNVVTTNNATAGVLEWGKPVHETYDVILGADVVAGIYDSSGLAQTIYDLSHDQSRIVLSYRDRLSGLMERFEERLREYFVHIEKRQAESDNKNPTVYILCISGKRPMHSIRKE